MFFQRLLTTLVLVPLVLLGLYYANEWAFTTVILLLIIGMGLEWLQLVPEVRFPVKCLYLLALLACCVLIRCIGSYWLIAGLGCWLFVLIFEQQYPKLTNIWGHPAIVSVLGLILLPLFGESMVNIFLLNKGKAFLVYMLVLVWAADIGAYLVGKRWGHTKLIPAVSPGKTYEGVLGGFLLSFVVMCVGIWYFNPAAVGYWFLASFVVALSTLVGDLSISMLKRRVGLKDTGHILPGHGGLLDRLDSMLAAAPWFYVTFQCALC